MVSLVNVAASQRLGLGARPGELEAIGSDPIGWALGQFAPDDPGPETESGHNRLNFFFAGRRNVEQAKKNGDDGAEKDFNGSLRDKFVADISARTLYATTTATPFRERLVQFWSNHFTVSTSRPFTHALAVPFETEAIRPHINGKFSDMLLATARHPAMVLYLDNAESIGPDSPIGRKTKKGLNENYAREVMELHTLGVDGGYTQTDVTTLARILTGWMVESPPVDKFMNRFGGGQPDANGFVYINAAHEPGTQTLLGRDFDADGQRQGEEALLYLAGQEATARHIARKLALHFVSDNPPDSVIGRWARLFHGSGGDLSQLNADIVRTPEVWEAVGSKVKTPQDFVVAALRAIGIGPDLFAARPQLARALVNSYAVLGQPAFAAPSPAGWSDLARDWVSGSGIKSRIDWTLAFGGKIGKLFDPMTVAEQALGLLLSDSSRRMIAGAPTKSEGLALLFLSPEFMRR